jgi:hypothetical protein
MEMDGLFDLFLANVTEADVRLKPRSDLSIHVRNVVRVLRARKAPLAALGEALREVLAAWDPRVVGPLVVDADTKWLDGGAREALLKELLQELEAELRRSKE